MSEFFGHFHPVLVHLPIGILLLACLFQWLSAKEKYASLKPAISISLLIGMLSSVASVITGLLLSNSDDYDETLVSRHQWFGISVAVVSLAFYIVHQKKVKEKIQWWMAAVLFLLIVITGHLGGSLTHGSDYLTQPGNKAADEKAGVVRKPIPDVQEAVAYTDIIQPLLQTKCYGCHGPNKQKGKLRMDQPELLMKGGKDGIVIESGNPGKSELVKRVSLPREDEDHMPPKEKPQLTEKEIALLHWWVSTGASFNKKTKELAQTDKIKPILLSLQNVIAEKKPNLDIPAVPVEKADEKVIKKLKDLGVVIMPVAINSNYLLANFITAGRATDKEIELLLPLKKQLVWLKLSGTKISDAALNTVQQFTNLTKLQLDNTAITDKGLASLTALKQLQTLNLVGTKITAGGMMQLKELKQLRSVFLYQTDIERKDWENLKKTFGKTQLDSGGYEIPFLDTDTMLVKPPANQ